MDHDALIKSIRKNIFYRRVGSLGNNVLLTGITLQFDIVKRFLSLSSFSHLCLTGGMILVGGLVQLIGWRIADKARSADGFSVWLKSYSEIKRQLTFSYIIIGIAFLWILGLMFVGSRETYRIDYGALFPLCLCSFIWLIFFADILLPRHLPKYEDL